MNTTETKRQSYGPFAIDQTEGAILIRGEIVEFSKHDRITALLLAELIRSEGRVCSPDYLINCRFSWGCRFTSHSMVRARIARIRAYCMRYGLPKDTIRTIVGVGYAVALYTQTPDI